MPHFFHERKKLEHVFSIVTFQGADEGVVSVWSISESTLPISLMRTALPWLQSQSDKKTKVQANISAKTLNQILANWIQHHHERTVHHKQVGFILVYKNGSTHKNKLMLFTTLTEQRRKSHDPINSER